MSGRRSAGWTSTCSSERCGVDPPMCRIFVQREPPFGAGQAPQVIQLITGRRRYRVVPVRKEHRVAVANGVCHALAVFRVEHLLPEAVSRIDAEVVHLLERGLAVAPVVLMRR